ncbi:processive endoglucanase Cel5B [Cytophaga hutchinsonii]|jgi:endoglucanase|uniref:Endoglucanase, glycoside hydrolase family 5 protein n=2 Tax=Cytophaga hutchinsonii (strain ATCC 33406 / DSM 1761 / CIP 103989 / NBRC 15051 / NCIMB 9469 / D465) TaxID=269798 RepID=A0A6N4ST27_CYTH3|nr:glycoside hydrolase family 5 protein [Cytophaga hutchinsonii]ABG59366.1 endoglucanase, glycoside hydrolase family 5 protein [Cytophaga hutchinsonii ATCC 33406]SFX92427.1 endoglucanase [Cytophaga hutchinsonii ATCC 33406]
MIKKISVVLVLLTGMLLSASVFAQKTIVEKYGKLSVKGNYMVGQYGDTVQLRGMSLFWSQWMGQYYNSDVVKWLRDDWKCTVVRAAMGVEMDGYLENPDTEKMKVMEVVNAAIAKGIYVIIDYHSHEAQKNPAAAQRFFSEMAKKYGNIPNIIYEVYNEPLQATSWNKDIKPYAEGVITKIRVYDTTNIIVVGTRQWSQLVTEAAANPITRQNIMYTLHFYPGTHKQELRNEAQKALDMGIALFVTEYGTCDASGNGNFSPEETALWYEFLDAHKISYCNWSIADKPETASAIVPAASPYGGWADYDLTPSGKLVRDDLRLKNGPIFDSLVKTSTGGVSKKKSKTK